MPVMSCTSDGKPGYKYGPEGKCYTYTPHDEGSRERARAHAEEQGRAIRAAGGKNEDIKTIDPE